MKKIVLTGAPSSGKSSALKHLMRLGWPKVAFVPETARVLLGAGYPTPAHGSLEQIHAFQKDILSLQASIEAAWDARAAQLRHLVLDRGRPDGAGFWPAGEEDYFRSFSMNAAHELSRYDHVLFLALPPEGDFGAQDAERFHDYAQSLEVEQRLNALWARHPGFELVPAQPSLEAKIALVEERVRVLMGQL